MGKLLFSDNLRHRGKGIKALCKGPWRPAPRLLLLDIACCHIEEDAVSQDVSFRLGAGDLPPFPPDHNPKLDFVMDILRLRRQDDLFPFNNQGGWGLQKDDRLVRHDIPQLFCMTSVIPAEADDLCGRDGLCAVLYLYGPFPLVHWIPAPLWRNRPGPVNIRLFENTPSPP